jgi:hypothetical protein
MFIAGVLVMASAAGHEIRATWLNSVRGSFEDVRRAASGKPRLFLGQVDIHLFAREHKRKKYCLTASAFVGW